MILLLFALAIIPALGLLWYIRRLDKYEPEPWQMLLRAFLFGCVSVLPALAIERALPPSPWTGFWATVYQAFVVAALTEEFFKGALAHMAVWWQPNFNEVLDGLVYYGMVHMGFAVTENLAYIFLTGDGSTEHALMTALVRTTTAVPMHVLVGMIMGYHAGVSRFATRSGKRLRHALVGLALPILLHGLYDLAAFNQSVSVDELVDVLRVGFGSALLYGVIVALWLILLPRVREAQSISPFRPRSEASLPVHPDPCPVCGCDFPLEAHFCHRCGAPVLPAAASQHR
jgi:RsiW-degrading membrane proteinase PrsW (M82 family)